MDALYLQIDCNVKTLAFEERLKITSSVLMHHQNIQLTGHNKDSLSVEGTFFIQHWQ